MSKIIILGSSPAGVKAAEKIRSTDQSSEITILSLDGCYPSNRDLFASFASKEITKDKVLYKPKEFYEQNNIKVVTDKEISRVNLKRNKIFTEEKEQIDYDVLIIADLPNHRFPDIKGTNKDGVYGCKKLGDIDSIVENLLFTDSIIIQSDSLKGLEFAAAFVKRGKEVFLILSQDSVLSSALEPEVFVNLVQALEEKGLRIVRGNSIAELLGDGDLKAVRLKSGKVIACQVVIFEDTDEDMRFLSESPLEINKKVLVDSQFKTNLDNVFAIDAMCECRENCCETDSKLSLSGLESQGEVVAAAITGGEAVFEKPLALDSDAQRDEILRIIHDKIGIPELQGVAAPEIPAQIQENVPQSIDLQEPSCAPVENSGQNSLEETSGGENTAT